jgi:osmotically inducible protein OsmC
MYCSDRCRAQRANRQAIVNLLLIIEILSFALLKKATMIRHASAVWNGSGKEGKGTLNTQSGVLQQTQYSYNTRFAEGIGTNPEELVAAAHAGCFTMKLSFTLGEAGFTADTLDTKCEITFENGAVTKSHLIVRGSVPGISKEKFEECVKNAEENCPISKLLNTEISSEAALA